MTNDNFGENADGGKWTFRGGKFDLREHWTQKGGKWVITLLIFMSTRDFLKYHQVKYNTINDLDNTNCFFLSEKQSDELSKFSDKFEQVADFVYFFSLLST